MVNFTDPAPFEYDNGVEHSPKAICAAHERGLEILKTLLQINTVLAGAIVLSLAGKDLDRGSLTQDERNEVILQVITCSVFLAAIAHSVVLLVCTGWRYTLTWYDPLFPTVISAAGTVLLYITLAKAILLRLRPAGEDLDTAGFWSTILFALNLPMALAGPLVTVQMVMHKFSSISVRSEMGGSGRELI